MPHIRSGQSRSLQNTIEGTDLFDPESSDLKYDEGYVWDDMSVVKNISLVFSKVHSNFFLNAKRLILNGFFLEQHLHVLTRTYQQVFSVATFQTGTL